MQLAEARAALALLGLRLRLPLAVCLRPLDEVVARAGRGGPVHVRGDGLPSSFERVERVLSAARVVPDTCLYRALARWAVLHRAGRPVRFVMGVRADEEKNDELTGHAWVEEHGVPLGEELDVDYTVTYSHPPELRDP